MNIMIRDNEVQVPIAVAANVCDITVALLVERINQGSTVCTADADAVARGRNN